jgi:hypothetical protein
MKAMFGGRGVIAENSVAPANKHAGADVSSESPRGSTDTPCPAMFGGATMERA